MLLWKYRYAYCHTNIINAFQKNLFGKCQNECYLPWRRCRYPSVRGSHLTACEIKTVWCHTQSSAHPLPPVPWHPAMEQYPHGSAGGRKAQWCVIWWIHWWPILKQAILSEADLSASTTYCIFICIKQLQFGWTRLLSEVAKPEDPLQVYTKLAPVHNPGDCNRKLPSAPWSSHLWIRQMPRKGSWTSASLCNTQKVFLALYEGLRGTYAWRFLLLTTPHLLETYSFFLTPQNSVYISSDCGAISAEPSSDSSTVSLFFFSPLINLHTPHCFLSEWSIFCFCLPEDPTMYTLQPQKCVYVYFLVKGESFSDGRITWWLSQELADVRIASRCKRADAS